MDNIYDLIEEILEDLKEISKEQGIPIITSEQRDFTEKYAPSLLENDVTSMFEFDIEPSVLADDCFDDFFDSEEAETPDSASVIGKNSTSDDDDIIFNPVSGKGPYGQWRAPKKGGAHRDYFRRLTAGPKDHECKEGMTAIDGWTICKHCGDNLRRIR